MPVVINQFEIVSEPPPVHTPSEPTNQAASPSALAPTPHGIEVVMRHLQERLARVRVY
ncbi:MAG: hypothetical protein ABI396_12585 [Ktedonobacteraceae bacterium]